MTVEEQLAAALAEVESLRTAIAEKDCIIRDLQNRLLWLRKKVFGQMSEKVLPSDPAQLSLFDEKHLTGEERARLDREAEEAEKTITKTITVKAKPSRRPLDTTGLPEKVFHIYPDGVPDGDGRGLRRDARSVPPRALFADALLRVQPPRGDQRRKAERAARGRQKEEAARTALARGRTAQEL